MAMRSPSGHLDGGGNAQRVAPTASGIDDQVNMRLQISDCRFQIGFQIAQSSDWISDGTEFRLDFRLAQSSDWISDCTEFGLDFRWHRVQIGFQIGSMQIEFCNPI